MVLKKFQLCTIKTSIEGFVSIFTGSKGECLFSQSLITQGMIIFYWSIIALQCCVHFCCTRSESALCIQISSLPTGSPPTHLGHSRAQSCSLCAMQERPTSYLFHTWWHYVSEKAMAPRSSTLAWKIPWTEEPGRLQSAGSLRVRHHWETSLSLFTFIHWRRKWQPTPLFLPGEFRGRGSLVGCCLWGRIESDTTEVT